MTVMVLGGAGYIGSHMVDRLVAAGKEKVVVVDSLVTGHRAAVNPAAKFYQGDLAEHRRRDPLRRVLLGCGIHEGTAEVLRQQHRRHGQAA